MCIGKNQPGGPKRCEGDALTACRAAQAAANDAASTVQLLENNDHQILQEMEIINSMQQALSGDLPPEREAELIERADRYRTEQLREQLRGDNPSEYQPEPDTPADWDRRIADAEAAAAGDRAEWERIVTERRDDQYADYARTRPDRDEMREWLRVEYEQNCEAYGETPTVAGLDRYLATEMAAADSHHEHIADKLSGAYLDQWRNEAIECHRGRAAHMDIDEALQTVEQRLGTDEFSELIATRDAARNELDAATEQWNAAKEAKNASAATNPYRYCTDPDILSDCDAARERLNEASAHYLMARKDLEYYQDCTAQYAGRAGDLYAEQLPTHTGTTLGRATRAGEYEQSTRPWLEARQQGFGGSDIGTALGFDDYERPSSVIADKLRPITDEDVAAQLQGVADRTGAAPRGHAWEQVTAKRFNDSHPDLQIRHTKALWRGTEPWQQANLDEVIVDRAGNLVGPFEAKTANNKALWDNGIPLKYRAQLAHQIDTLGTDRGAISVTFDDGDTRTYWMRSGEPLDPNDPEQRSYGDRKPELRKMWATVEEKRAAQANPAGPAPARRNSGTFKWIANPNSPSSHDTNAATARQLAVYRGCSIADAESMIQRRIDAGEKADAAVRNCYRNYHPRTDPHRRFVVVDFETNGTHAGKAEVIQTGYQVIDGRGQVHEEANAYHDINPRAAATTGVGMQDVHRISYSQIMGTQPFHRSPQRDRLRELANDPNVTFVAHSANFERSYLEANAIPGSRFIDTMNLSKKFDHDSTGATLADFTQARGIAYRDDAHDAYVDCSMTAQALTRFWDTL